MAGIRLEGAPSDGEALYSMGGGIVSLLRRVAQGPSTTPVEKNVGGGGQDIAVEGCDECSAVDEGLMKERQVLRNGEKKKRGEIDERIIYREVGVGLDSGSHGEHDMGAHWRAGHRDCAHLHHSHHLHSHRPMARRGSRGVRILHCPECAQSVATRCGSGRNLRVPVSRAQVPAIEGGGTARPACRLRGQAWCAASSTPVLCLQLGPFSS